MGGNGLEQFEQNPEVAEVSVQAVRVEPEAVLTSPYPRGLQAVEKEPLPIVGRRVAWDVGIAGMGLLLSLYACANYLDQISSAYGIVISALLTINLGLMFIAQKRGEARVWQSLGFHFLGFSFGCLFAQSNPLQQWKTSYYIGGSNQLYMALFSTVAYVLLGGLSRILGVRAARVVDRYEAARHSWATLLILFPVVSVPLSYAFGLVTGFRGQDFDGLVIITCFALQIAHFAVMKRSCKTVPIALTYIWTPIVLGSPIVLIADWLGRRGVLTDSGRILSTAFVGTLAMTVWAFYRKWPSTETEMPAINSPDSQSSAPTPARAP